jgi:uncharacterized membrane protein YdjX (TVP38/TMEM64 family)
MAGDMKTSRVFKGILLTLILGLGAYLFIHFRLYTFWSDPEKLVAFIESFHPYDVLAFIAFEIFQVLIAGAIPAEISGLAGGYLYGPALGAIYSTIGLAIGSWLAFTLARVYGLPLVRKVVSPSLMAKYDCFMEGCGPAVAFVFFVIPGFPKAALCYILGLSVMNVWKFVAVSTVGRLFGIILLSICGSSMRHHHLIAVFIISGILIVALLFVYCYWEELMAVLKGKNRTAISP